MKLIVKNLEDTDKVAEILSKKVINRGAFICLYGDIGAGKTTFTKSVAKYCGVKENVTSPSFVILNEYHSGDIPIYHFDLYRLEQEGVKTVAQELDEYSGIGILTLVEWAEYSNIELPDDRLEITIKYINDESRSFEFKAYGDRASEILKGIKDEYTDI